ncbi:similar to Saccharomyces cerevisiae YDL155W CLB3 B-type cyclin involved in cell cycle progression [Maudiozyma barnettii]|uniref:Similar to Saccharomyces cerevisiae YDL155W CLB3 B-type cyclin involved in cell cycle progression n=1 Tax=Maudiozyma barnettii TaxID=61262 RepID=A0A8H2VBH0_9SACH|nr:B-type cyclin CLB3 [Kazachstania barnettii]CAB4252198.1 similar to Saccharomyces cerevisiae YDL155W CLB3 B-type cyclin involved in cell cycle progression [Kazachstania barnettii]CAD1778815.1 similar to Saccharomyces cerevisiae YDL155W CLB3 B-type cyclin involved in cell cycle progression [Kazachstania barnettii]
MYQSKQPLGSNENNQSVFTEKYEQFPVDETTIDKENIIPYNYQSIYKGLHTSNSANVSVKNTLINKQLQNSTQFQQHRSVLSDVTSQVNNKLNSVPSNSTLKSDGGSSHSSSSTTNSVDVWSNHSLKEQQKYNNNFKEVRNSNSPIVLETNENGSDQKYNPLSTESNDIVEDEDENNLEDEQQTNEYSAIESDDNNDHMIIPLELKFTNEINMILDEAHNTYYRDTLDLMDEDTYDVVMVAELTDGIFDYLRKLEMEYKPNPNYMHYQKELRWSYRRILLDWIVEVHNRFQLLPETLYLTVNLIDRFLSKKSVMLNKFQLVGAAALFIAAKYEEINCPSLKDILYMLNDANTKEEIIEAERFIIDSLEFEIGWPGPMSFLRRISKADDYEYEIRTLAKYLLESTIMDPRLISIPPSWLAAAAYFLSKVILGYNSWSLKHTFYAGYTQEQILPLATIILENCRDASHCHKAILKKYSNSRQHNSAQLVARWIGSAEKKVQHDSSSTYGDGDDDDKNEESGSDRL